MYRCERWYSYLYSDILTYRLLLTTVSTQPSDHLFDLPVYGPITFYRLSLRSFDTEILLNFSIALFPALTSETILSLHLLNSLSFKISCSYDLVTIHAQRVVFFCFQVCFLRKIFFFSIGIQELQNFEHSATKEIL